MGHNIWTTIFLLPFEKFQCVEVQKSVSLEFERTIDFGFVVYNLFALFQFSKPTDESVDPAIHPHSLHAGQSERHPVLMQTPDLIHDLRSREHARRPFSGEGNSNTYLMSVRSSPPR